MNGGESPVYEEGDSAFRDAPLPGGPGSSITAQILSRYHGQQAKANFERVRRHE